MNERLEEIKARLKSSYVNPEKADIEWLLNQLEELRARCEKLMDEIHKAKKGKK